ncbi:hypothetical protein LKMONMHP_4667 [Methylobacterium organophilum]|uniref:Uncharacterized protein n=2 Tax=Methylobacterium organophilum TaxID=410 RepID=A0ABQ4TH50_METOR|nr:hypothetical protein LKMONMHP_4667 [Methylobacterium organophilum]
MSAKHRRLTRPILCLPRLWSVRVDGFGSGPYDPVVKATTMSGARYAAFKALRDAGYFSGRDGFRRFLANGVEVWPANFLEEINAPRIGGGR